MGIRIVLNSNGELELAKYFPPDDHVTSFPVRQKQLAAQTKDDAFKTLRAVICDDQVRVWLDGQELCEPMKLPDPFSFFTINLTGVATDEQYGHAEFDSVRVWRAGDRPIPPLPTVAAFRPKPIYENDFSDWLPGFPRPHEDEDEAKLGVLSIRDGHYVIQSNIRNDFRWTDFAFLPREADIELVGRRWRAGGASSFTTIKSPRNGVRIGLDSAGKLDIVRFSEPIKRHANIHSAVSIRPKPLTSWKPDGQFNVLRAELKAGKARLWVNGEEACEPFELPDAIAAPKIGLSAYGSGPSLHTEFDAVRIWRAGEGPPLRPLMRSDTNAAQSEDDSDQATAVAKPLYGAIFPSQIQTGWARKTYFAAAGST